MLSVNLQLSADTCELICEDLKSTIMIKSKKKTKTELSCRRHRSARGKWAEGSTADDDSVISRLNKSVSTTSSKPFKRSLR